MPLQAPLQPAKVDPPVGVAVSVTVPPLVKVALQVLPHSMPAGLLVTVPVPPPVLVTVKVAVAGGASKVAVTVWLPFIVTTQAPVPLQAPPQPANVEPPVGVAVSVTVVPLGNVALHVVPQLMPPGLLVTVPVPVPFLLTVKVVPPDVKVAVTVWLPFIVTTQGPVPLQAPPQPRKVAPPAGVAVSVTVLPLAKLAAQSVPHAMPAGSLVTVPSPLRLTVSSAVAGAAVNSAFTVRSPFRTTVQDPVPL